jgi:restriction system protein
MKQYYYRRKYYQGNQIKTFRDLVVAIVKLAVGALWLILLVYIIPAYVYIINHPIFLIPVVFVIVLITGAIFWYIQRQKTMQFQAIKKFNDIMNLSPREFEEFIEDLFRKKWFETVIGKWTKDWWVDVTATLDNKKFIVQCKHYSENNKIWSPVIQQLNWVIVEGFVLPWRIFVTTSSFTADAVSEAKKSGMELWDKDYLIDYLKSSNMDIKKQKDDYWICENCWWKLVLRTTRTGAHIWEQFLWCECFPDCRFTKNI